MKSKNGAILIGYKHSGQENANLVINELERQGIKEGDVLADEISKAYLDSLKKKVIGGRIVYFNIRIDHKIETTTKQLEKEPGNQELQVNLEHFQNMKQDFIFQTELMKFFLRKKIRVVPLESNAMFNRTSKWLYDTAATNAKGNVVKKMETIGKFITFPVRENHWKKVLQSSKPKFVMAGATHLPAIKRMTPYKKCIDLSQQSLRSRTKERIKADWTRLQCKVRQEKRKIKQRMSQKKKSFRK